MIIGDDDDDNDEDFFIELIDFSSTTNQQQQQRAADVGSASASTSSASAGSAHGALVTKCGVVIPNADEYERVKWLFNDIKDCSLNYRSLDYEHTPAMLAAFRTMFGLKAFRPQQFEAINSALLGRIRDKSFIIKPLILVFKKKHFL